MSPFTRLPAGRTQSVVEICFLISLLFWKPFPDRSFTTIQQIMTSSSIYYSASAYYHEEHQCPRRCVPGGDQRTRDIWRNFCKYTVRIVNSYEERLHLSRVPSSCHAKIVVSTSCFTEFVPRALLFSSPNRLS